MKDLLNPFPGFDETTYLALNSDVNQAVQEQILASGWEHFILFGYKENRPGVLPAVSESVQAIWDSLPVYGMELYPADLWKRVHGNEEFAAFVSMGKKISLDLEHAITLESIELQPPARILDFGCGCGRVVQHFHGLHEDCDFYGTDIDAEAILWCQNHLVSLGEFVANGNWPPLPFPDEHFDLVYAISVFTHLPEDMQLAWLEELRRVTKKGGYLLLTTHGEELLLSDTFAAAEVKTVSETGGALPSRWRKVIQSLQMKKRNGRVPYPSPQLPQSGFHYSVGDGTPGLPDFYQTSFHTEEYVRTTWSRFFEIKRIIKKGIARHQDLVVCRKPI